MLSILLFPSQRGMHVVHGTDDSLRNIQVVIRIIIEIDCQSFPSFDKIIIFLFVTYAY